jgi:16S rRNA (cytosine967-C5)-methyltransferase
VAEPRRHDGRPPRRVDPGVAVRVEAARALASVVFDGRSLRDALAEANPRLGDPRDRALLAASLFEATRWWLRYEAALARLVEQMPKSRPLRALLVLALVQLAVLGMPDYAVVAACVEATRALDAARYAGLANAVLRRFVREREALEAELDRDPVTRHAHPRWLLDAIARDWPGRSDAILAAANAEAPLTLRVNRRRATRGELLARLAAAGVEAQAPAGLADALVLARSVDVTRLPGYAEGEFSVQDGAAQCVAAIVDAVDGQRVLDACAAPGGKSAHLLECARLDLVALDRDARRLARMRTNLDRLGLAATIVEGDVGEPGRWWDGRRFDRILVDAPCSATGIVRRQPDIKLHRRAADIAPLAARQAAMLDALWPLLERGGRLVYATCSLLRAENEAVLAGFLAGHDDARALPLEARYGHAAGVGRQNLPGEGGMDGFHYAAIGKA